MNSLIVSQTDISPMDQRMLNPETDIDNIERASGPERRTDIEDPDLEAPYYDEPVEDPETEDDIVNGVDDDDEDGLPDEDESELVP